MSWWEHAATQTFFFTFIYKYQVFHFKVQWTGRVSLRAGLNVGVTDSPQSTSDELMPPIPILVHSRSALVFSKLSRSQAVTMVVKIINLLLIIYKNIKPLKEKKWFIRSTLVWLSICLSFYNVNLAYVNAPPYKTGHFCSR